jgi:hypothetical protein
MYSNVINLITIWATRLHCKSVEKYFRIRKVSFGFYPSLKSKTQEDSAVSFNQGIRWGLLMERPEGENILTYSLSLAFIIAQVKYR